SKALKLNPTTLCLDNPKIHRARWVGRTSICHQPSMPRCEKMTKVWWEAKPFCGAGRNIDRYFAVVNTPVIFQPDRSTVANDAMRKSECTKISSCITGRNWYARRTRESPSGTGPPPEANADVQDTSVH